MARTPPFIGPSDLANLSYDVDIAVATSYAALHRDASSDAIDKFMRREWSKMADYAYTTVTGKIRPLLEKIQEVGIPTKATQSWLAQVGFPSSNDRSLLAVLRQIGYVDASGRPTNLWEQYRGGNARSLASGIQQGYSTFYSTYADAHRRSNSELENIVKSTAPRLGKDAVSRTIQTFKALAGEADFSENSDNIAGLEQLGSNGAGVALNTNAWASSAKPAGPTRTLLPGLTVNLNVQLSLPETTDGAVYESLFAAMREHLLEGLKSGA